MKTKVIIFLIFVVLIAGILKFPSISKAVFSGQSEYGRSSTEKNKTESGTRMDENEAKDAASKNDLASEIPEVSAQAALTLDISSNKLLYEKNIHARMYPASTTKLLTAQVLADNKINKIVYTKDAKAQEPNKLDLRVGEVLSTEDAMDAMLIYSANDVAEAIGDSVGGDIPDFAEKMNKKAASLGLTQSNFVNPNGLPNDNHYTTAFDLSKIAKNVYKYPSIMDVLGTKKCTIATSRGSILLENTNKLLDIDGCIGGKTGYTAKAGKCLVAYYERNGRKMIGIVMASASDNTVFNDMQKIIDWSYNKVSK